MVNEGIWREEVIWQRGKDKEGQKSDLVVKSCD